MDIEHFYQENYAIVYGYLRALCRDSQWAEDLTSETFLKAIIKIDSYDGRVKASTWLCTIGKNLYLNEVKKRKRQAPLDEARLWEDYDMEEQVIHRQKLQQMTRLAQALEEPKNRVFLMRLQGLSFRQIGDAFGKTETWARVTFFRAKERIIEQMEGSE